MRYVLLIFLMMLSTGVMATHNRAGEITYKWKSGSTYIITVTTYTKESSATADRCSLTVKFGDNSSQDVPRSNGVFNQQANCRIGESLGDDIKKNEYTVEHTYPAGTGTYLISVEDPNRNLGILNIPVSVQQFFYLESELIIFGVGGAPNSSPILTNPPVDVGCRTHPFEHNPGAVDFDLQQNGTSDSLSYRLIHCKGQNGVDISGYKYPDEIAAGPNNVLTIDPLVGTLEWHAPQQAGEYNVAILIEEWRRINGIVVKVGSVLRDMQIEIYECNNQQPKLQNISDECIVAGTNYSKTISASDPDEFNHIRLFATGDPFFVQSSPATFINAVGQGNVSSNFVWNTDCSHVRTYPYQTVYQAKDSNEFDFGHISLSDYEVEWYTVIAPRVENPLAVPVASNIELTWDVAYCQNAIGYRLYRREGETGWTPGACETGVPSNIGYSLLADISDITTSSYVDDNNGQGLVHGIKYSYLIYYYFEDGSESIASVEFGTELKLDIPIVTMVSVNSTSVSTGSDSVRWAHPIDFDKINYPGPYQYKLFRKGLLDDYTEVWASPIEADFEDIDTVFVDQNLNTEEIAYTYKLEMYNDGTPIGNTRPTPTPFLNTYPLDNRLVLIWDADVPWDNYEVIIYKLNPVTSQYEIIDTTENDFYVDSNLVNGREYCYYVRTVGEYSVSELIKPIFNNSQKTCGVPEDKQAPCPPQSPVADANCELFDLELTWQNPNLVCDTVDDVVSYNLYFRPFLTGEYELLDQIPDPDETSYSITDAASIAGCYVITAVDSFQNESGYSDSLCVDNCPEYILPNVFTPGGDGYNDFFIPLPYRYVDKIDLKIFNRWGEIVFESNDPNIRWDGTHKNGGERVPAGTYFYVCEVFEIRLRGIIPRVLKGHVTLLNQEKEYPTN